MALRSGGPHGCKSERAVGLPHPARAGLRITRMCPDDDNAPAAFPRLRPRRPLISGETLVRLLRYDAESGLFHWLLAHRDRPAGAVAGYWSEGRGLLITVAGTGCLAQDLAWLWCHGRWPERVVEHVDGDRANNRCGNLRLRA